MAAKSAKYVIAGGGLAAASAVEGIRELDKDGPILLIGHEKHLPYDRPPLTKKLWFGKKKVEEIFLHDTGFYEDSGVTLALGVRTTLIDPSRRTVVDSNGNECRYDKLLLATGGVPRTLSIPGGDVEGICYYRYLDDYVRIRERSVSGARAVIVGGGFIGSELAAALNVTKVDVTWIFPDSYLCSRVFPESLARAIQARFEQKGVKVVARDKPASFQRSGDKFVTTTEKIARVESDILIVGIGIDPEEALARAAGLQTANGVVVDEYLETSIPGIFAAGDNASFPYKALGRRMRVEHWDNALNQGRYAGRNMAGARVPYDYMPYFFSDLFEFGYEAVGDVSSRLETLPDWQKENDTGVIFYLADGKVRGAMMCNVWDKVEAARALIRSGESMHAESVHGTIV